MLKVCVIGYGYWGKNIARVVAQSLEFELHSICDSHPDTLSSAGKTYPGVRLLHSVELIGDEVDVVAVITPADTHFRLAKRFLEAGKHVLLTKPFTKTLAEAEELMALARERERTLFVDHTFLFNPAVRKLKEYLPRVGKVHFILSQRLNLGLYQPDVSVMYDLMPHDFSIISYLFETRVRSAQSYFRSVVGWSQEDLAHSSFELEDGIHGLVTVSWLSPFKIRQFFIVGSEGMLLYDDVAVSEKVKFFEKGVSLSSLANASSELAYTARVSYRSGDLHSPAIPNYEALAFEMTEFRRAVASLEVRRYYEEINLNTMKSLSVVLN